jgi:hypothetical protein
MSPSCPNKSLRKNSTPEYSDENSADIISRWFPFFVKTMAHHHHNTEEHKHEQGTLDIVSTSVFETSMINE